ncbi:MAG TPA: orotate phosphoribosyltransferase [Candidatus Dormibacteraeota bacterium]|nr:orotate phosphoribosyltransferase [Candidatus Dormibacteraeota bacterium]
MQRPDQEDVVARELSELLYRIGVVRFGEFTLKDGRRSPFYLDMRVLVSHPAALARIARALLQRAADLRYDRIAGLPYAGLPLAVAMSLIAERPMIYVRKEAKAYGTKNLIEGEFAPGERALMVDDVVTSGGAKLDAVTPFRDAGLVVEDVVVIVDRSDGAAAALAAAGLRLHSVLDVRSLLAHLRADGAVPAADIDRALDFLASGPA